MRGLFISSIFLLQVMHGLAQDPARSLNGKVTFIASENVYVRFDDTRTISIGDTLRISTGNALNPCLVVTNKSSSSCVAVPLSGCAVKVGDKIVHTSKAVVAEKNLQPEKKATSIPVKTDSRRSSEKIRGSISAGTYSNFSSANGNTTKAMYRLSFVAPSINHSKFSFETYMNYRQTFLSADNTSQKPDDVFNVYSLALKYDPSPSMSFVLGRRINPRVSSIGAIDGLQVEKSFGNFYAGLLGGFRPDIIDYTFNADLLQYGAYVGLKSTANGFYSATTLGLMEQNNNGNTDRRYTYFQHSSTINEKINIFSSFELDIYNQVNADSVGDVRLTNLFVSVGYRISRKVDFSLSYSSRKQILYYETFKTEIERLLDDDIARQGFRFSANVRPVPNFGLGATYSKRFQTNDLNKSDNINGYATWSKIPFIGGGLYLNYNRNTSNYMQTNIMSFRHYRTLIKTKLDGELYFRMVDYDYLASEMIVKQQYYGASLSYRIARKLILNVLGELATTDEYDNYRVNARLTKNF